MKLFEISVYLLLLLIAISQQSVGTDASVGGQSDRDANQNYLAWSADKMSANNNNYNYKCCSEGYFIDPRDCSKYYRCVHQDGSYIPYHYSCRSGYEWDYESKKCNLPSQIHRQSWQCKRRPPNADEPSDRLNSEYPGPDSDHYNRNL